MRDLFRPGSGLTVRRLVVLIRALPAEALVWASQERSQKAALKPTPDQIRSRQEFYRQQREKGATDD